MIPRPFNFGIANVSILGATRVGEGGRVAERGGVNEALPSGGLLLLDKKNDQFSGKNYVLYDLYCLP